MLKYIIKFFKLLTEENPISGMTFGGIVKHPLTFALILVGLGGGFLLRAFISSSDTGRKDCQTEITYWQAAFDKERTINLQLTNRLLDTRQDFKQYKDSTVTKDSTIKRKLVPKALKIIKTHKP